MAGESVSIKKQGGVVLEKVKSACARRGANGIRGLQRMFKIFDDNHSLSLTKDELQSGLQDYGVVLNKKEMEQLVSVFDKNGDGMVCIDEFLTTIRGGLKGRRLAITQQAFAKFDRDGSGRIDVNDLRGVYDATKHPKVISGELTEDEVMETFLTTFDDKSNPDGVVTKAEFEAYYAGLSASIDNDDYFELMMNNTWKLDEELPPPAPAWSNEGSPQAAPSPAVAASAKHAKSQAIKHLTSLEAGIETRERPRAPAKRIVGYTGHVAGSQETFGTNFSNVETNSKVPVKKAGLPPPVFKDEARVIVRKGNRANQHSFRLE